MKALRLTAPLFLFVTVGCTQPGETTGLGAAAGGALGAGLGAIIGSQSGAAGSGLALGAVAGSAGGALIGNAFQAQQEAIRTQDEAIERQERMVRAQRSEIEELRKMNQDTPSRRAVPSSVAASSVSQNRSKISVPSQQAARRVPQIANSQPQRASAPVIDTEDLRRPAAKAEMETIRKIEEEAPRAKLREPSRDETRIVERDLTDPSFRDVPIVKDVETLGEFEENRNSSKTLGDDDSIGRGSSTDEKKLSASSCQQAKDEMSQSSASSESSEKLYHLRRALRLCPENPAFHHELGKVYLMLKRPADAEYEFKQALSVDPSYKPAQRSLNDLDSSGSPKF